MQTAFRRVQHSVDWLQNSHQTPFVESLIWKESISSFLSQMNGEKNIDVINHAWGKFLESPGNLSGP